MDKKLVAYWVATGSFGLAMLGGGVAELLRFEDMRVTVARLGYPEYLLSLLGVAKLAGVAAILAPGFPRLKEWAYAGFAFDLLAATISHMVVGDPVAQTAPPVLMLAVAATSYLLRPESRRLPDPPGAA